MYIGKTIFRTALIGGLAVGGLTLLVGPQRVMAGAAQIQHHFISWFDSNVEDPTLIRYQLKQLQKEYPEKIRETIRNLAEIDAEIGAVQRDRDVAERMIATGQSDLASLRSLVDKASYVQQASYGDRPVLVKFQGQHLSVEQAYSKAATIQQTAMNYSERLAVNERDLKLLLGQRDRMTAQLDELQNEYAQFQAKTAQIERQIASIERNESITKSLEEREEMLTDSDRWNVCNLDQIVNRLSAVQSEQAAMLEALSKRAVERDYEKEALGRIALENIKADPFSITHSATKAAFPVAPIVVDESTPDPAPADDAGETVAALPQGGN
ncbi:MAG: hypothetical protein IT430_13555 [Phycisphaerales bacterium]|nr:hypothetical protein [Phycisphaerales bacterium]